MIFVGADIIRPYITNKNKQFLKGEIIMMPVIDATFCGINVVWWYGMAIVATLTAGLTLYAWYLPPKKGADETRKTAE